MTRIRDTKHDHNDDNLAATRTGADGQRSVMELDGHGRFHQHTSKGKGANSLALCFNRKTSDQFMTGRRLRGIDTEARLVGCIADRTEVADVDCIFSDFMA